MTLLNPTAVGAKQFHRVNGFAFAFFQGRTDPSTDGRHDGIRYVINFILLKLSTAVNFIPIFLSKHVQ